MDSAGLSGSGGLGDKRYPSGLAQPFHFGFDARQWEFCSSPVFEASFDNNNKYYHATRLGEVAYDLPD
ncbi:MAG TPA: hypothetical protein VFR28_11530, partial [Allosphingosinicella sp.]|nr:hypothetical protein [Allosphingosinicella sp.]